MAGSQRPLGSSCPFGCRQTDPSLSPEEARCAACFCRFPRGPNLSHLVAAEGESLTPGGRPRPCAAPPTYTCRRPLSPWVAVSPQEVTPGLCVQNTELASGEMGGQDANTDDSVTHEPASPSRPSVPFSRLCSTPPRARILFSSLAGPQKPTFHLQPLSKAFSQRKTVPSPEELCCQRGTR